SVPAIEGDGGTTATKVLQGVEMRARQIGHMDVVAHAGAIRRVVVGAENGKAGAFAERRLAGDLDQQGGLLRGLAYAALRVATRDIEVPKRDIARTSGRSQVAQHPLAHQFG